MDLDILKHFVKREVEILVGGVWISGYLSPIAKGVIVLTPLPHEQPFYGPASMKAESVQAIRQLKTTNKIEESVIIPETNNVKSSFENSPKQRFIIDKATK